MYAGKLVFAQVIDHLPLHTLRRCVARYYGDHKVKTFTLPALSIAKLYRLPPPKRSSGFAQAGCRWQVELFFKWIKQHLRIKAFYGTSENAVRSQIWIAVPVYVLVAIIKKRLGVKASLYTILQILSVTPFEKTPVNQAFFDADYKTDHNNNDNQLKLFD